MKEKALELYRRLIDYFGVPVVERVDVAGVTFRWKDTFRLHIGEVVHYYQGDTLWQLINNEWKNIDGKESWFLR